MYWKNGHSLLCIFIAEMYQFTDHHTQQL